MGLPKNPANRKELPPIGTKLEGKYLKVKYSATVVASKNTADGRAIRFGGKVYSSMSAAAQAITKHPKNGWLFWKIKES